MKVHEHNAAAILYVSGKEKRASTGNQNPRWWILMFSLQRVKILQWFHHNPCSHQFAFFNLSLIAQYVNFAGYANCYFFHPLHDCWCFGQFKSQSIFWSDFQELNSLVFPWINTWHWKESCEHMPSMIEQKKIYPAVSWHSIPYCAMLLVNLIQGLI